MRDAMILCFHPAFMSVLVPITRNPKAAVAVSLPSSSSLFSVCPPGSWRSSGATSFALAGSRCRLVALSGFRDFPLSIKRVD